MIGDFTIEVPATTMLDRAVDVLWVSTKAVQLESALALAPNDRVGDALVVPLLNGIDHLRVLRGHYRNVAAGAIRIESHQTTAWQFRQTSPFLRVDLPMEQQALAEELRASGIPVTLGHDELSILWNKLALAAPITLATAALAAPLGAARRDPRFVACCEEALSVAVAEATHINAGDIRRLLRDAPASMQSAMQLDIAAGRSPDIDAIAGPIIDAGTRNGIPTPATEDLIHQVRAHLGHSRRRR